MRRRLDLAAALVVSPPVMFMDEPTTGLDPRNRQQLWDVIQELVAVGTTVLLTTQYLDEADQLADRVAVIDHGRLIAEGATSRLKASVGGGALRVRLNDPRDRPTAERVLKQTLQAPVTVDSDPSVLTAPVPVTGPAAGETVARALAELSRAQVEVTEFALGQPSLHEVFLALTGNADATPKEEPR
jgi:ABC-2 type transport system ATP-binding protein